MEGNKPRSVDDAGERFVQTVVWVLDRLVKTEYQKIECDGNGNPVTLELSTKPLKIELLEHFFATFPPIQPKVREAILALKERHTREDIERALGLLPTTPEEASELAGFLDGADWPDIARVVDKLLGKYVEWGDKWGDDFSKQREGFGSSSARQFEQHSESRMPTALILTAAQKYAKEFRDVFPEMVERAKSLRILVPSEKVPEFVRRYLIEASRCYIYGHFLASLLVCRAAIEEAIKRRLIDIGKQEEVDKDDRLVAMLCLAKKDDVLLDQRRYECADDIRKKAGMAVHGKEIPEDKDCMDALHKTRGILEHLYGRLQ